MNRTKLFLFFGWMMCLAPELLWAQDIRLRESLGDESQFYAETKQINQFFRRFNGEESFDGERLYQEESTDFRSLPLRLKYLPMLFDAKNRNITDRAKQDLVADVITGDTARFLNFHGGNWFAEVKTSFFYQKKEMDLTLFMRLEKENLGSKWVIHNVYFEPFQRTMQKADTAAAKLKFLHPMSHELDFMNLNRVFENKDLVSMFADKAHRTDYLTLFLYEIGRGNLIFDAVQEVKFHFFQIPNWYFEVSRFERPGYNTGWLISNLVKIPAGQQDALLRYIYHED